MTKGVQRYKLYLALYTIVFVVGLLVMQVEGAAALAVGGSLAATGVAGWIISFYVLGTEDISKRLELLTEFGFRDAFPARAARIRAEYDQRIAKAHQSIEILGFGLRALREDYLNNFRDWSARAKVRILLLDPEFMHPDSLVASQRDIEEGNPRGTISSDAREFLKAVGPVIGETFQVRLYRCLPSVNIFRVDDELFWGPYLIADQSRNMPTFLVRRGGLMFERLSRHFDQIWDSDQFSRDAPADWFRRD